MNRLLFLSFFAIILSISGIAQQDSILKDLPKQWTLKACIEYAKQKNISLATLRLTERSTEEDLLQSKAAVLPNLTGTVTQSLTNGNNSASSGGGIQSAGNYGVNSSMILYNGRYLKNDIRSKELTVQSANLHIKETENDLSLSIAQSFFNILLAKENISSLQSVLTTSQEQLKQGQLKYDAGGMAKKDLLQLQSQVAADAYSLVNATNIYKLNLVTLKQILLLPSAYDFTVSVPDSIPVIRAQAKLDEAQNEAQQARPEIQNGQLQVQIAKVELDKIKAFSKPTLSLGGAISSGYFANQSYSYFTGLNTNLYQSLGLTLGIPIYSRRVNLTNTNKTKLLLDEAKLSLINTKTQLNQLVEQAYINLQNAEAQYSAANTQLKANAEIYRITNEQLKLGAVTTLELLQQKNLYVQALEAFSQAKYSAALYNKIYEFYMGNPLAF